ncbi:MAG: ABC transporter permease, partial [Flavobacteriaceae bacterium]
FFPLQASFNLLHEPFTRLSAIQSVVKELGEDVVLNYQTTLKEVAIAIGYTLIYLWSSLAILKKRDL